MAPNSTQPGNEKPVDAVTVVEVAEKNGTMDIQAPKPVTTPAEQYKIVKVRMPDGTIKSMKRKITPADGPPNAATRAMNTQTTASGTSDSVQTVLIKMPDGSTKKITRRLNSGRDASARPSKPTAKPTAPVGEKSYDVSKSDVDSAPPSPATVMSASTCVNSAPVTPRAGNFPRPTTPPTPSSDGKARKLENSQSQEGLKAKIFAEAIAGKTSASDEAERTTLTGNSASGPSPNIEAALDEQADRHIEGRTRRFRRNMIRGIATVAASAIPALEITDWNHDDIMGDDSGDDWWDDDEDDGGNTSHDGDSEVEDFDPELHHGVDAAAEDNDLSSNTEDTFLRFDAGQAVGATATAFATAATQPQPQQPPPVAQPSGGTSTATKGNMAYNVTARDLDAMDEKAANKDNRQLKRQWSNISFYILASFIITFPLLFIVLGVCIVLMHHKPVDSKWNMMENAIKVGVSAWPIVFAAVVAQIFKAWATYKVERGVKLLELEQLIGSNSFSSAMKQPFLLRNLNFLALGLFGVWCLSPLGSQALQRVYTTGPLMITDQVELFQLDNTGNNPLFGTHRTDYLNSSEYDQDLQLVSTYYLASFLPMPLRDKKLPKQDRFDNPHAPLIRDDGEFNGSSAWGVPLILPNPTYPEWTEQAKGLEQDPDYSETIDLDFRWSYFNLSCGEWSIKHGGELTSREEFSWSNTWGLSLSSSKVNGAIDRIQFASKNGRAPNSGYNVSMKASALDVNAQYSYIECGFKQVIVTAPMHCKRLPVDDFLAPDCDADPKSIRELTADEMKELGINGTQLRNFAEDWVVKGSLLSESLTPTELYLFDYSTIDYAAHGSEWIPYNDWNLTRDLAPSKFASTFQYEFNTWVGLGYCPQCLTVSSYGKIPEGRATSMAHWTAIKGTRTYSTVRAYEIVVPWLVVYFVSSGILLLAGIGSIILEARVVAPDVLGYVSTVARNSKYLKLPKTHSYMSAGERLQALGSYKVMMQDVAKKDAPVGRIALGLKTDNAQPLQPGRLYR